MDVNEHKDVQSSIVWEQLGRNQNFREYRAGQMMTQPIERVTTQIFWKTQKAQLTHVCWHGESLKVSY